ncbi:MAG: hypothetical protein RSC68_12925, partial [Acinetobacter sp.]
MAIEKLSEFAKDGQKNTDDLNLTDGFPVSKKPARQWFNWLFNSLTSKVNEIIENKLDKTANAVSSSKLETARTVSFSGAATGSFSYDGSSNSSAILTLANSGVAANTYGASLKIPIITVNAKGLITGVSEQNIPIVDNLTTDDSTKPISAKQAKFLNENKLNRTGSLGQEFNLARRDFDGIHTEYTWLNGPSSNIAGTLFFNYSNDWIGKIFFDIADNRMFAQSFQSGIAATPW